MKGLPFAMPLALLVTACTAPSTPASDPNEPVSSTDTATATPAPALPAPATPLPPDGEVEVASLAGEWRVAAVDGSDLDASYGLALSASETEIWWAPRCAGQDRGYRIAGQDFRATQPKRPPDFAVCEIGWPDRLPDVWRAIDAAERVERLPSNGVLLSGGGHSLLLFSQ